MPQYKDYPTEKSTPNRKSRKGERNKVFQFNKIANRLLQKARKDARKVLLEVEELA